MWFKLEMVILKEINDEYDKYMNELHSIYSHEITLYMYMVNYHTSSAATI